MQTTSETIWTVLISVYFFDLFYFINTKSNFFFKFETYHNDLIISFGRSLMPPSPVSSHSSSGFETARSSSFSSSSPRSTSAAGSSIFEFPGTPIGHGGLESIRESSPFPPPPPASNFHWEQTYFITKHKKHIILKTVINNLKKKVFAKQGKMKEKKMKSPCFYF